MIKFTLTENDVKGFENAMRVEMEKPIKHFEGELIKIRTGRAHTSMVEDVNVIAYGSPMTLKSLAALAAPEVNLITIQPWDTSIINDIEKAITISDLGVSPINDGKIIRIQLPRMSATRRDELLKILGKKLEDCRVSVRNVRKEFNNIIRDSKADKTISENFYNRLCDVLQTVTDKFITQAEQMSQKKEKELTSI